MDLITRSGRAAEGALALRGRRGGPRAPWQLPSGPRQTWLTHGRARSLPGSEQQSALTAQLPPSIWKHRLCP